MAIIASIIAIQVDIHIGTNLPESFAWLLNNQPDGARAVLSTIAGSTITVAGVVFSITLVTLSGAAAQYGPRLLTNFMRDTTNQLTLGTFIATFLYCLLVLRAVQNAPTGADADAAKYFVPHIALFIGLGFALASIVVLIRFIHHVPRSIHISLLTARIGQELREQITRNFGKLGGKVEDSFTLPTALSDAAPAQLIRSKSPGFVTIIDLQAIKRASAEHDKVIRLRVLPGDFVFTGQVIAQAQDTPDLPDEYIRDVQRGVLVGMKRTPAQDIRFLIQELVEIAMRALSSGINDPVTAISCLNWLGEALNGLPEGMSDYNVVRGDDEKARVFLPNLSFEHLLQESFGVLCHYCAADPVAAQKYRDILKYLEASKSGSEADRLKSQIMAFETACRLNLSAAQMEAIFTN